jgi:two-component system OmpR family response regulator
MHSTINDNSVKALIVDDEVDICYLLSGILRHKNLKADFVHSIGDAKKILTEDHPSIIFLDNHLPDGYGVNFIDEIKKIHPEVKIVMITAHDSQTDRKKAYEEGADHFIGKPFSKDIILKTVETLIA